MLITAVAVSLLVGVFFLTDRMDRYGIDSADIVMEEVSLDADVAENIAEDIAELIGKAWENVYEPDNFKFTFYKVESESGEELFRVSVEMDRIMVREPEDSPVIIGMKKAQSELTYEAERTYAQTMIDSMLAQIKQENRVHICEPAIFATVNERGRYVLAYGDTDRTPLEVFFTRENAEQEEFLGYLTVYQQANINPPMDVAGSYGYMYSKALENPENILNRSGYISGLSLAPQPLVYYRDGVYAGITTYEVKNKEKLPWDLLGEEIKTAYSNSKWYWSERDALMKCTGTGTLYRVKGYEDSYRIAVVYEQNWRNEEYIETQMVTSGVRPETVFQSIIGQAEEEEIQPGGTTYYMVICEHMNGLWFHKGKEVFQQRMHLENSVSVNGLSMEEELLWNFLAELNAATFAPVTTRGSVEYETVTFTDVLGMKHSLKLNEEGYVKVQACNAVLTAKIDEELSRRVMEQVQTYEAQQPLVPLENAFPVEKVFAKDEGFETVYDTLLEQAEQKLFNEDLPSAWFGEPGYYISRVPVYYYNALQGKLKDGVNLLLLSRDFDKSSAAHLDWSYAEPTVSSSAWYHEILEMMRENPQEEYICIELRAESGLPGIIVLDAENKVCWSGLQADTEFFLEGILYEKLYSDELAVSYEELTAKENLIWIPVKEGAARLTPSPIPVPTEIPHRSYQDYYEENSDMVYPAEKWLADGKLTVPFTGEEMQAVQSLEEQFTMYYIPEEALKAATTEDIIRVACDWPFAQYNAYSSPSEYLKFITDNWNGMDELLRREDLVSALLNEYKSSGFYVKSGLPEDPVEALEYKKKAFHEENTVVLMEILLATDEAFERVTSGQREGVLASILYKMEVRETKSFLASEKVNGFFTYIKENSVQGNKWYTYLTEERADASWLRSYLECAVYPTDNVPVSPSEPGNISADRVLKFLEFTSENGDSFTLKVVGKRRSDIELYGVRELIVYQNAKEIQRVQVQEAIAADGVYGIEEGYSQCHSIEEAASLKDVNFDGYPDIEVWGWTPNNSIPYYYWCWNPETQQYEYAFCLQLTEIDVEKKLLIEWYKVENGVYQTNYYRVTEENGLELVKQMTEDVRE